MNVPSLNNSDNALPISDITPDGYLFSSKIKNLAFFFKDLSDANKKPTCTSSPIGVPDDIPNDIPDDVPAVIPNFISVFLPHTLPKVALDSLPDFDDLLLPDFYGRDLSRLPFPVVSFEDMKRVLGRKWRNGLEDCFKITSHFHDCVSDLVTIPTNSIMWIGCFGSMMGVTRALRKAELIGLLKPVTRCTKGCATFFAYNHARGEDVMQWCSECGVVVEELSFSTKDLVSFGDDVSLHASRVNKTPLKLTIAQRANLPKTLTDAEIVNGLAETYPQLREAWETVERLNASLPADERMKFSPHIKRSRKGNVTKIGIRCTNPLVSTKKEDDQNILFKGKVRDDVLKKKLGDWVEYDVKASVPTISMLLTKGILRKDGEDMYSRIAGTDLTDEQERKAVKALFLPLYFESSGNAAVWHRLRPLICGTLDGDAKLEVEMYGRWAQEAMDRIEAICGRMGSEVFLHESCIYLNAFARMVEEEGWRVIQIYDGFYIQVKEGDDREAVWNRAATIVKEEMLGYARRWFPDLHSDGDAEENATPEE
jgi:hypothetical protein